MWNLIFGDEEDSSPEDQDLDGKKLKDEEGSAKTVEEVVVVTVPTHQFSPGKYILGSFQLFNFHSKLLFSLSCQTSTSISRQTSWRWNGRSVKLKDVHT